MMRFTTNEIRQIAAAAGYLPVAAEGIRGYAAPELAGDPEFSLTAVLRSAADPGAKVCKDRPKTRAVCADGRFFKNYRIRGWWKLFRYRFRTPRPFRGLKAALALNAAGIATPEVLLALRGTVRNGVRNDWLVTAELPAGTIFADRVAREQGTAAIELLLDELTPAVAVMHAEGIEHGDLNLRNLYRLPVASDAAESFPWGVIDLDGVRIGNDPVAVGRRCRETARLATSLWLALPPADRNRRPWPDVLEECARHYEDHAGVKLPRRKLERFARRLLAHHPTEETKQ